MATTQTQVTIPSNGSQVLLFSQEALNANQLNLRNTGTNTVLLGPQIVLSPPSSLLATPSSTVAYLPAPSGVTATAQGTGGTFTAGTYYFKVTALNAQGETVGSSEASATVVTNGSILVSWSAVTGATGYNVYRSSTPGGESTTPAKVASNINTTSFTATGTAPSAGAVPSTNTAATGSFATGTYYWVITSLNAVGETIASNEAAAVVITQGVCTLTWNTVSGATSYKIYRSTTVGGEITSPALVTTIASPSTSTYTDTGAATTTGAAPITNTATLPVLFPLLSNEILRLTVGPDDTLVGQVQTTGTAGQITILATG